eukprot:scaffold75423_cov39-Tisochrysis_lutea.AAC.2
MPDVRNPNTGSGGSAQAGSTPSRAPCPPLRVALALADWQRAKGPLAEPLEPEFSSPQRARFRRAQVDGRRLRRVGQECSSGPQYTESGVSAAL